MDPNTITKSKYLKNLSGVVLIGVGAFLIIEHIWSWGSFDFFDIVGHDWLGFLMVIIGIVLNLNFNKKRFKI